MKLHNLLLTAALFVSSAIAFAKDYDDYTWYNESGKNTITVSLTKPKNQNGFKYAVYDVDALARITNEVNADNTIAEKDKADTISQRMNEHVWTLNAVKGGTAYTKITLPKGEDAVRFGVIEYNHNVSSVPNISNNFAFYTTKSTPANTVYFGKLDDMGGGNDKSAEITFGAPLPAPVVTLLIALGFGGALVMYRNRKVKA